MTSTEKNLEGGWVLEERKRAQKNHIDRYWFSPLTKKKLRSRVELDLFKSILEEVGISNEEEAWGIFLEKRGKNKRKGSSSSTKTTTTTTITTTTKSPSPKNKKRKSADKNNDDDDDSTYKASTKIGKNNGRRQTPYPKRIRKRVINEAKLPQQIIHPIPNQRQLRQQKQQKQQPKKEMTQLEIHQKFAATILSKIEEYEKNAKKDPLSPTNAFLYDIGPTTTKTTTTTKTQIGVAATTTAEPKSNIKNEKDTDYIIDAKSTLPCKSYNPNWYQKGKQMIHITIEKRDGVHNDVNGNDDKKNENNDKKNNHKKKDPPQSNINENGERSFEAKSGKNEKEKINRQQQPLMKSSTIATSAAKSTSSTNSTATNTNSNSSSSSSSAAKTTTTTIITMPSIAESK